MRRLPFVSGRYFKCYADVCVFLLVMSNLVRLRGPTVRMRPERRGIKHRFRLSHWQMVSEEKVAWLLPFASFLDSDCGARSGGALFSCSSDGAVHFRPMPWSRRGGSVAIASHMSGRKRPHAACRRLPASHASLYHDLPQALQSGRQSAILPERQSHNRDTKHPFSRCKGNFIYRVNKADKSARGYFFHYRAISELRRADKGARRRDKCAEGYFVSSGGEELGDANTKPPDVGSKKDHSD